MLGFDMRAARSAWSVALVAMALVAIYSIRHTLFIFVLAVFFSYMVQPLVRALHQRIGKRIPYAATTAIVFVLLLLALAGLIALAGPPIAEQASVLRDRLPELTSGTNFIDNFPLPDWLSPFRARIGTVAREYLANSAAMAAPAAQQIGKTLLVIAGNLIYLVVVPILSVLFIVQSSAIHDRFISLTDNGGHATMWRAMADDLDQLLGRYMRALLLLSLATILSYGLVFSIAGLPYGLLLAVLAGALEFIPVLGPLLAAVGCVLVAGLSGYGHLLPVIGFIAAYRLFQDYVLSPRLMSNGVSLPALLVLFGLLAGEEVAGVVGVFLSVPVLAAAKIAIVRISQEVRRERAGGRAAIAATPPARAEPTPVE